jgi:hypothetical protein
MPALEEEHGSRAVTVLGPLPEQAHQGKLLFRLAVRVGRCRSIIVLEAQPERLRINPKASGYLSVPAPTSSKILDLGIVVGMKPRARASHKTKP